LNILRIIFPGILKGRKSQQRKMKKFTAIKPFKNFLKSLIKGKRKTGNIR
jgi:hypothetical protein